MKMKGFIGMEGKIPECGDMLNLNFTSHLCFISLLEVEG